MNVYHTLLVHARIVCGRPRNVRPRDGELEGWVLADRFDRWILDRKGFLEFLPKNEVIVKTVAQQCVFRSFWLNLLNSAFTNSFLDICSKWHLLRCINCGFRRWNFIHSFTLRTLIPFYNNCSYLVAGHIFSLAEPWFSRPFFFLDGKKFRRIFSENFRGGAFSCFLLGIQICYPYPKPMVLQS